MKMSNPGSSSSSTVVSSMSLVSNTSRTDTSIDTVPPAITYSSGSYNDKKDDFCFQQ